jgi:hypothetical protein
MYTIQSSEKTKAKGSEFETKALLYLMNFRNDSKDIYFFVVDFFNDLTGLDRYSKKSWDLQSKAAKNNYQKDIGKELVTLYKNYCSDLHFDYYILFLGGVAESIRKNKSLNIFTSDNITDKSKTKIIAALVEEAKIKTYIPNDKISLASAEEFFEKVTFVIDDKEKSEYIKSIVKVNPLIIPPEVELERIFNQIRDAQSSKKNNNNVEGVTINTHGDFIYHNRHLTTHEIKLMVLNRLINRDLMQKGVTDSFIPIYAKFPKTEQKEMLEDCQHAVAKTLFDKNNSENFWDLFNNIYTVITENKDLSIDESFDKLDLDLLQKANFLDLISVKYFMAIVKDGIYDHK